MVKDLTTLVGTCDAYLAVVPNFHTLYSRYFEPKVRTIYVSETNTVPIQDAEWITPGTGPWGARMLEGLSKVDTDYVFFVLEDYYLSQLLTIDYVEYLLKFMCRHKADKISLTPVPDFANHIYIETIDTIYRMSPNSSSMTSLQPAIWKTTELKRIMQPNYTPWDFEIIGESLVQGQKDSYFVSKLDQPIYFNLVRQGGVLTSGWVDFFRDHGLKDLPQ